MPQPSSPHPPFPRRWRWGLIGLAAVGTCVALVGLTPGRRTQEGQELLDAVEAALDQNDPRWRWEDVLASRRPLKPEENSAPLVTAAVRLLPPNWPEVPAIPDNEGDEPDGPLVERLLGLDPVRRLTPDQARALAAELEALEPALTEARKLRDGPLQGAYPILWHPTDPRATLRPHLLPARAVAQLLVLDAVQRAEAGRGDEALASARGALLAGRSVGDEPLQAAWWTDLICSDYAARAVERILAQTEPSPGALAATQALLERQRHDLAPNLLWMLRSERAAHHRVFAGLALGTIKRDEFDVDHYPGRGRSPAEEGQKGDYLRHRYRTCQALAVVEMTRLVQAFALPPEEQAAALDGIDSDLKKRAVRYAVADDWRKVSLQLLPPFIRLFKGRDKLLAALDGASVALAVERFLHDRGHLPARGEELVPAYLAAFPTDPFLPGQPLRFLRSDDHLVIYAVGPDRTDNQGYQTRAVGRNVDFVADGEDVGIRLWVSEQRRQPPPKPGP